MSDPSNVVGIDAARIPEITRALEEMLERARRGEFQSMSFCYESVDGFGHRYIFGKGCNTIAHVGEVYAMATLMVLDIRKEHV